MRKRRKKNKKTNCDIGRLKLATCSADGYVRIYEAIDVMNMAHWPLVYDFEAQRGGGCNCISWNLSAFDREMLAVGSNDQHVKIWEYSDSIRKWVQVLII
jgi:nucleoporin SEH1